MLLIQISSRFVIIGVDQKGNKYMNYNGSELNLLTNKQQYKFIKRFQIWDISKHRLFFNYKYFRTKTDNNYSHAKNCNSVSDELAEEKSDRINHSVALFAVISLLRLFKRRPLNGSMEIRIWRFASRWSSLNFAAFLAGGSTSVALVNPALTRVGVVRRNVFLYARQ